MVSNALDLLIMLKVRCLGDYGKWFRLISALPPSLNVYFFEAFTLVSLYDNFMPFQLEPLLILY